MHRRNISELKKGDDVCSYNAGFGLGGHKVHWRVILASSTCCTNMTLYYLFYVDMREVSGKKEMLQEIVRDGEEHRMRFLVCEEEEEEVKETQPVVRYALRNRDVVDRK